MVPLPQLHQSQRLQAATSCSTGSIRWLPGTGDKRPGLRSEEQAQTQIAGTSGPCGEYTGNSSGWEGPGIALELPVGKGAETREPG